MSPRVALPVSIGLLGGIDVLLFAHFALPSWAGLIAMAAVLQAGGDTPALKRVMLGSAFGAVCAWVAALIFLSFGLTGVTEKLFAGAAVIGAVMIGMSLVANLKPFSGAPFSLFGYAATWAYIVQTPGAESQGNLTHPTGDNALLAVLLCMWGGALFGLAAVKLAGVLSKG